jgi:glycosyltransferase involved in cell wall biosynthesis
VRLTLVTEIPAPFRIPLFNELAARAELDVVFLSRNDPKRPYPVYEQEFAFGWSVLPGRDLLRSPRWVVLNRDVGKTLARSRPDALVVGGWNQPAFWASARWAKKHGVPLVLWVESTARDARTGFAGFERAKRRLLHSAARVIVPGVASRDYVVSLGYRSEHVIVAPNAVDPAIFDTRVEELRARRDALRAELGVEGCTFLYVGRLDPEKGVDLLLHAMAHVPEARLAIVSGGGSDEEALRAGAPPNVRFVGRVERPVEWYVAADAFVLPSRSDQWGMVLNEAAAAGLPIVASDAAGGTHDLVVDGVNGFQVAAGDAHALAEAIERVCGDDAFRATAGARSREIARGYTPELWAAAVATGAAEAVR